MLNVLTYRVARVEEILKSTDFRKLEVQVRAASSIDDLVERSARLCPDVVLIAAVTPDHAAVARRIRSVSRSLIFLADASGLYSREEAGPYDGLLCLDDMELELCRARLPCDPPCSRRHRRLQLTTEVELHGPRVAPILGVTLDVSPAGAGVQLDVLPTRPGPYQATFRTDDGRAVRVGARIVWMRPAEGAGVRAGLRFLNATFDTAQAICGLALWQGKHDEGEAVIVLRGELTELGALWPLAAEAMRAPILDLGELARFNFVGAFRFIDLLRRLPVGVNARLRRVPVALTQSRMLVGVMRERCIIESYYATFNCEQCKLEVRLLLTPADSDREHPCPMCGRSLVGDLPSQLLGL